VGEINLFRLNKTNYGQGVSCLVIKVLMLNFSLGKTIDAPSNVKIYESKIKEQPTLHDFHVIVMDTNTVFNSKFWDVTPYNEIKAHFFSSQELHNYGRKVKEQIETGGITFLFCGKECNTDVYDWESAKTSESNYFSSPISLGIVNDKGDTFYPSREELKYYSPLIKKTSKDQISYQCYFTRLPKEAKVLGTTRAGFPIFAEVPIGNGKLVVLPRFEDIVQTTALLINEVLPQIVHEDEPIFMPAWLSAFSSDFEKESRNKVDEIEKVKRLLYTKDKLLKKAVAFTFEKLGFSVIQLPDGTNPDLVISFNGKKAICEVKGHENRQSDRPDMLQLLGYSTEDGTAEKGIFVSNSEFCKPPQERKKDAFTQGAIKLGVNNEFSLLNSVELFDVTMLILQGRINDAERKELRDNIMNGVGLVHTGSNSLATK
jgi:hypothetical protein